MQISCFRLQPVETPQPEGERDKMDEYFTSQIDREREDVIYNQVNFPFPRENKENVLFSLYLPNLAKAEEIDELMLLEFHEKTGSFVVDYFVALTKPAITCSRLTTKTLEQGIKYVQS